MKRISHSDRRHEARFPQNLEVVIGELPQLGSEETPQASKLSGRVQNISQRGMCLITSSPIEKSAVVRCEIAIGDAPLHIATLMRVRWTQEQSASPEGFITGLEALL